MSKSSVPFLNGVLDSEPLCVADFLVEGGIIPLGQSPFGNKRVGYISGGSFQGERLNGSILPGGGNWSATGVIAPDLGVGTFDARAVWKTEDGATIYVTYTGRSVVSKEVSAEFADPAKGDLVDPQRYYIRIAPVFETGDERYTWLNGVLAVGCGHRMPWGIRHHIFAIK